MKEPAPVSVHTLAVPTDGGPRTLLWANTEGLFRIIQSIPSPKAEPVMRRLAKVGHERIREIVASQNSLALTQSAKTASALAKPAPPRRPGKP
jgi:hypothetical protein